MNITTNINPKMSYEAIMTQLTIAINSANVKDYSSSFLKELLVQKKQLLTSARASERPFISNKVEEIEKELAAREHLRVEERYRSESKSF
jgi:hypothetical protein